MRVIILNENCLPELKAALTADNWKTIGLRGYDFFFHKKQYDLRIFLK